METKRVYERAEEIYCEDCVEKRQLEEKKRCIQIELGQCRDCGYERNKRVIVQEEINRLNSEKEEMERVISGLKNTDRSIKISSLAFERTEDLGNRMREINNPKTIIRRLQHSVNIEKEELTTIIRNHIEAIESHKEELKKEIPV